MTVTGTKTPEDMAKWMEKYLYASVKYSGDQVVYSCNSESPLKKVVGNKADSLSLELVLPCIYKVIDEHPECFGNI